MKDLIEAKDVVVIGAGMAGSEAVYQLAEAGLKVLLFEQKPQTKSAAHKLPGFAEMVCSNSFRSASLLRAAGLLKEETKKLNSFLMKMAEKTKVPAGDALAVDRVLFSKAVTEGLEAHPNIEIIYEEVTDLPDWDIPTIIATGPLTGKRLFECLQELVGRKFCDFYDAVSPIVDLESLDMDHCFWGSRNCPEDDDYLNCPLTKEEYLAFIARVQEANLVEAKTFEEQSYFEACLPLEVMVDRGDETLRYGPFKPVGLVNPKTGEEPYACLQLRAENVEKTSFNLVGCQSRMKIPFQKEAFSLIPAMKKANFLRYGYVHRNSYLRGPEVLNEKLALKERDNIFIAGQLSGVEGYLESMSSGLLIALIIISGLKEKEFVIPPRTTALGALYYHLRPDFKRFPEEFAPQNVNYGLFEQPGKKLRRKKRREFYSLRAQNEFDSWRSNLE